MTRYKQREDSTCRVVLQPEITRAYWSKQRAWPGDEVNLVIETRNVPDRTKVNIVILEVSGIRIDEIKKASAVKGGRSVTKYVLDWSEETLGRALDLENRDMEFYFFVTLEDFSVSRTSLRLYVDLDNFVPSV